MKPVVFGLCVLGLAGSAYGGVIKIENWADKPATLTDLIFFSGEKNTGDKTIVLQRGDATDDLNIAASKYKNFDFGTNKSATISWNNANGVEVETDLSTLKKNKFVINDRDLLAFFGSVDGGLDGTYAVAYDGNTLPDGGIGLGVGDIVTVQNGLIVGGEYDYLTFYEVTPGDPFIQRDAAGNPTSPLFAVNAPADFRVEFLYSVPAPGAGALLAAAGLCVCRRRRS